MRPIRIILPALLASALAAACQRDGQTPPASVAPQAPADPLAATPDAPPAAHAGLIARCRAAASYSREHDGEVMLVLLDGEPVFQDAVPGFTVDSLHLLASGTKSFCGIAAALAVEDGLLALDEKVCDTIHEWKGDPLKSQATVRQLLSLAAGLESLGSKIDNPRSARAAGITDRAAASIHARSLAAPGARFVYGPSSFYVFGELMRRKLAAAGTGDDDVVAYLFRKVFTPLGVEPVFLRDEAGNANLPGGCRMSARDWAAFGEFVRNGGVHRATRLVAEERLAELMNAYGPNKAYGLTWWLLRDDPDAADPETVLADEIAAERLDERGGAIRRRLASRARDRAAASSPDPSSPILGFMAAGKGKQRLYILPEQRLTVVRFGPLEGSNGFDNREFLRILLDP